MLKWKSGEKKRQEQLNWVIEDAHWVGFQDGAGNNGPSGLEYSSTSALYHLNPARRVAYNAGYALGQSLLEVPSKYGVLAPFKYRIDPETIARCHAAVAPTPDRPPVPVR